MAEPKPHSIPTCLALHLLPGLANFSFIVAVVTFVWPAHLPGVLAFALLANFLVLLPIQLGILFYLAKKQGNNGWSLKGIVTYQQSIKPKALLKLITVILVPTFLIFSFLEPVGNSLEPYFSAINISQMISYEGNFSNTLIIITMLVNILFTAILVPITEELYFRGYLLPRMPKEFGKSSPVVHSFLFALYHIDSLWLVPVRTVGLLPLIYVTKYSQSLMPGILSHAMVNLYEIIDRATDALD